MIRVLPENDDFYFFKRCELKRAKNVARSRIDDGVLILGFNELPERPKILLTKFLFQHLLPRRLYLHVHLLLSIHAPKYTKLKLL